MNLRIKTDSTQFITTEEALDENDSVELAKEEENAFHAGKNKENTKQKNTRITRSHSAEKKDKAKIETAANRSNDSVFNLTEKTKKLGMKSKNSVTKKANEEPEPKPVSLPPPPQETSKVSKRGTKRARAINNVVHEFEVETINQSQEDTLKFADGKRSKRRKSSIVEKPLLV